MGLTDLIASMRRHRETASEAGVPAPATQVTYLSDGHRAPTTLVEIPVDEGTEAPVPQGVGARLAARRRAEAGEVAGRPRGNPAFSEALFVELIRARQFHRAYEQLASGCRAAWGDPERFAEAQRSTGPSQVQSVSVRKTRLLTEWSDPETGAVHDHCAELEVDYTIGRRDRQLLLSRTVHLVGDGGKWRSLCYPPEEEMEYTGEAQGTNHEPATTRPARGVGAGQVGL